MFISTKWIKVISVFLAVTLVFGTAVCALAQDNADGYAIGFGIDAVDDNKEFNHTAPLDNSIKSTDKLTVYADKIGSDSATISWQSNAVYMSFKLCKYDVITDGWSEYTTTSATKVHVKELAEDTDYKFAVLAANTNEFLGTVEFTTAVKRASLKAVKSRKDSIELEIEHSKSAAKVYLYRSTDGKRFKKLGRVKGSTYTDKKLKSAKAYYYKVKCVNRKNGEKHESEWSDVLKVYTTKPFGLPKVSGSTKTYAYYTAVTAKRSPQYRLLRSADCYTDPETGIRMVDGCYCVAMGSYYGTKIGTKYRVTLAGGKEIDVILCDAKSNRHTDKRHQYAVVNNDIIEFYVEKRKIPRSIRGDYGRLPQFSGAIVGIEQYIED